MSAATSAAESGVVLGAAIVFLAQQFGYLSLSDTIPSLEWLIGSMIAFGLIGGAIGWRLGRRH